MDLIAIDKTSPQFKQLLRIGDIEAVEADMQINKKW